MKIIITKYLKIQKNIYYVLISDIEDSDCNNWHHTISITRGRGHNFEFHSKLMIKQKITQIKE